MTAYRQLADFILRFELGDIAASLTISMTVWAIFEHFDSATYTLLTLCALVANTFLMKRFSYLFDHYSKKHIIQWQNTVMAMMVMLVVIIDAAWLYLLLYWFCSLYFQMFYTVYNAMSQTLSLTNRQTISATLELSGKIVSFGIAGLIWLLFEPLGAANILAICVGIFMIAAFAASRFDEPKEKHSPKIKSAKKQGFGWYFAQPVAWLVTLAMMANIVVLLSNTIDSIYFYQVLLQTPESLAQLSMAFSVGSMIGAGIVFKLHNEKIVIYVCVITSALMSLTLAIFPTIPLFSLALGVFGLVNSASRVMFRLAIMKNIVNTEAGSFYGLRSSLVSGIQFAALLSMNIAIIIASPAISVWLFPAVFLALPILWRVSQKSVLTATAPRY